MFDALFIHDLWNVLTNKTFYQQNIWSLVFCNLKVSIVRVTQPESTRNRELDRGLISHGPCAAELTSEQSKDTSIG